MPLPNVLVVFKQAMEFFLVTPLSIPFLTVSLSPTECLSAMRYKRAHLRNMIETIPEWTQRFDEVSVRECVMNDRWQHAEHDLNYDMCQDRTVRLPDDIRTFL